MGTVDMSLIILSVNRVDAKCVGPQTGEQRTVLGGGEKSGKAFGRRLYLC